jgi:tRNA G18 (ribose-2'-O)-methylase SpoU
MGVLVRNCAGFSADGLLVGENSCSPFLRRAVAASMGTIFEFPALDVVSLAETLKVLRARGIRCVAAHPHVNRRTLWESDFMRDCCVVLGSEAQGIRPEILDLCDEAVTIPMAGNVDSLNVGSASAVFLYEAARQRGF